MDFANAFAIENLKFILEGFYVTLKVAFISIVLSFVLGCIVGTVRYTKIPVISPILGIIVEILRNLPLLLIIFFTRFALPDIGIKLGVVNAAIVALTLFEGAMISEIVRSGLKSIDKGQIEAARSSGLSYMRTLWHIILPQGLRRMVPPLVSQFISLLKDTSLAVIISLPELMNHSKIVIGQSYDYVFPVLLVAAILYFTVNYGLSLLSRRFESRLL
ncbi:amino acid ABC transporter permease [Paenibacillus nasutitermitis]|uniref:Glutamine ABC transporter permease n=1 Tax=Paenibacillus nasutitermitis TaxID=1652958 RepID=A0A917E157_9BACL|nr:amino acid ABC transporter permease [Paenibacillus nasutitermitis]GGD90727.1 glutamine ABC transporter permease [Paenibacillus nasutitermitis]